MLRHFFSAGHFAMRLLSVTIAAVVLIGFVSSASAQLRPWDANNQVMVDLSVLSDNGVGPSPQGRVSLPSLTGDILDPPSRMPRSRLPAAARNTGFRIFRGWWRFTPGC